MPNFSKANVNNLRSYKFLTVVTNSTGVSDLGRVVDTADVVRFTYLAGLSAIIPIMGSFELTVPYILKEADDSGGPFTDVPADQLVIKTGQQDLNLSYLGGGISGQALVKRVEISALNTKRFLRLDIDFDGVIGGGAGATSVSIYRAYITNEIVQPT